MINLKENVDVCVVGAGHAGCEAALACARLGFETVIFTVSVDSIALMPCNPNIGGTSKGHLVREIDALGGEMGKNIDKTFIQSKMLNKSKGPFDVPPMFGLQGMRAMLSTLTVNTIVLSPSRAHASAASQPACPAPITTASY